MMSDIPKYWQLKQPIKAEYLPETAGYVEDLYFIPGLNGNRGVDGSFTPNFMSKTDFEEMFVPAVDIETKRQAIEKIMDDLDYYRDLESYWRARDKAVDAVLEVLRITKPEKETKQ